MFVVYFCCCEVKRNITRRGLCHKLNQNHRKMGTRNRCIVEVECETGTEQSSNEPALVWSGCWV